jgi:urea transport system permease protein
MLRASPMKFLTSLLTLALALLCGNAHALDAALVAKLGFGNSDEKISAIAALVLTGDARAGVVLQALNEGELVTSGKRVLVVKGNEATDAATGENVSPVPADREDVPANNRMRRVVGTALAALQLASTDREVRIAAVKELSGSAEDAMLPLIAKALDNETDPAIRPQLELVVATLELKGGTKEARLASIAKLGASGNPTTKTLLLALLERNKDGSFVEPDDDIRRAARKSLKAVESRLAWGERAGLLFAGISLGTILMLAALGLAITYGLMGVINMAHGELIMIGAYTTYVMQNLFRAHLPGAFDWYPLAAVPMAFMVSGAVGMALERSVIRWLYGRPLETLLATWGISLMLIQLMRTIFGAQNVQVENPSWMSGGMEIFTGIVLPYSRIVIIFFALGVLAAVWLLLTRTRLGLFVRAVTQNRPMASCVGVPTARIDTWAFGLGSGVAGLAGCALSQIGNVGPDLGQAYIVDSFMVVVVGGVGQLAGTVYAALGLGLANKLLESWAGAVLAKIAVLVIIIIFIQKRPQGLFALKGRSLDS